MRLLIVEDEEGLASALRVGLTREGYAVDLALPVAEASEKLAFTGYDLALLDVTLPDGDGLTLAQDIRRRVVDCLTGTDLRIVMLTARGKLPDRVRGLDVGADDYLVKPFALAELTARLRAVLRRETARPPRRCSPSDPSGWTRASSRAPRRAGAPADPEGVRRAALPADPARPPGLGGGAARARLGRERRPVHPDRTGHRRHPAPQAHRGHRAPAAGDRDRPGLPAPRRRAASTVPA